MTRTSARAARRLADEVRALQAEDDGLGAVVIGLPRRLDGSPNDQTGARRKLARAARRRDHGADHAAGRTADEPRSGRAARAARARLAQAQTAGGRDGRRAHPAGLPGPPAPPVKRLALSFVLLLIVAAAGAGAWFYSGVDRPFKGYDGAGAVRRDSAGRRVGRDRQAARRRRRRARRRTASGSRCGCSGAGRRLQAGEYRFDRPMSRAARWSTRSRAATSTSGRSRFPKADHRADGGAVREQGLRPAPRLRRRGEERARWSAPSIPAAKDLEGYLFPDTYALPRHADRRAARRADGGGFVKALTPELSSTARGARARPSASS